MSEAEATTSESFLARLAGMRDAPKMATKGRDLTYERNKFTIHILNKKKTPVWSAGDELHLSQVSLVSGNCKVSLALIKPYAAPKTDLNSDRDMKM